MQMRAKILKAAVEVYSEAGFRGATTRRIAQKAGVNEVTLFRHFGSKHKLLREAIECEGLAMHLLTLPDEPANPRAELLTWASAYLVELRTRRSLIRTCMGEVEEHPDIIPPNSPTVQAARVLATYLTRLQDGGFADQKFTATIAAPMLMGILFADAMGRDVMPDLFTSSERQSLEHYVDLFLRAISPDATR